MAGLDGLKRAKVRGNQPKAHFVSDEILNGGFRLDVATTPYPRKARDRASGKGYGRYNSRLGMSFRLPQRRLPHLRSAQI